MLYTWQETVAALITSEETSDSEGVGGIPLFDDQPIDFSKVACNIDGVPMVNYWLPYVSPYKF